MLPAPAAAGAARGDDEAALTASPAPAWCIFANDALGEATGNAQEPGRLLRGEPVATPDRGRAARLPGLE